MSDRALRARSRSRGPSGRSSPQMYDTYAEESFQDGYRAGYQRGCYMDGESRGFLDGYNARRMKKAQGYGSDEDSAEEERNSSGAAPRVQREPGDRIEMGFNKEQY